MVRAVQGWNLYWVESDGVEDCFVAARNRRSACAIECNMNGFDPSEVTATKIISIPKTVEHVYKKQKDYREHAWPWYVYGKRFFKAVGAEFRKIENQEEMLLADVVYLVEEYGPCGIARQRSIGFKAVEEIKEPPGLNLFHDDEDVWRKPEVHIITALGICLARCHQIENYIVQSFLLGIGDKQKPTYRTISDMRAAWRKKTFGAMLKSIEDGWDIDPLVKANFEIFLRNRNRLIHGLTTEPRFDIRSRWGQLELWAFLAFFDVHSRIVKLAFRSSYFASIQFGIDQFGLPKGVPKNFVLRKKDRRQVDIFYEMFSLKQGS